MKLLALRCPKCDFALAPGQEDRVVQCPNCRVAVAIEEDGLELMAAQYAASKDPLSSSWLTWLPFWVYRGKVTIKERKTQGGRSAEKEAAEFWEQPRRVYIPAWSVDLSEARDLVGTLLEKQPFLEAIIPPEGTAFEPAILSPEDGRKLLEVVIVTLEAERRDWMETLDFDLRLDSKALWLLPARRNGAEWQLLLPKI